MPETSLKSQWTMLGLCAAVGLLAAMGAFGNINNFPLIFAAVLVLLNGWETWSRRAQGRIGLRVAIIGLSALLACAGWWLHKTRVQHQIDAAERTMQAEMIGRAAPSFDGFEALNVPQDELDLALETKGAVTLVAFWARWCSPCWKEMEELDELHRAYAEDGLRIVGITRFDNPDDADARQSDADKAKRFLDRRGYRFPAGIGRGETTYAGFRVRSPPVTVLIDRNGTIVGYSLGLDSARELMQRATALLPKESA